MVVELMQGVKSDKNATCERMRTFKEGERKIWTCTLFILVTK